MSPERVLVLARLQDAGLGAHLLGRLEDAFGPVEAWWAARCEAQLATVGIRPPVIARLLDAERESAVARAYSRLEGLGYRTVPATELAGLEALPDPPLLLHLRGPATLETARSVAVVGARRATGQGRRIVTGFARELAAAGLIVLSGLARGCDAAAHRGALAVGGVTAAVLGCGPDLDYPPEHRDLRREIEERGLVLTEHLPGTPPRKHHFPRRNRIIVGLAAALLVGECRIRSGTLTSVRWAADLGREVLVIPGAVDSPLAEGPIALLREGATPVGRAEHVLEALGLRAADDAGEAAPSATKALTRDEARLLALLGGEPLALDEIVRSSSEAPGRVMSLLLGLEIRGRVVRDAALRYRAAGEGR